MAMDMEKVRISARESDAFVVTEEGKITLAEGVMSASLTVEDADE